MFDHYQNTTYVAQRQQAVRNEADMERLAAEAEQDEYKPFYAPVLNLIGHTLVDMGNSLQERYGEVTSSEAHAPNITTRSNYATASK